jgi:hypothetical protein
MAVPPDSFIAAVNNLTYKNIASTQKKWVLMEACFEVLPFCEKKDILLAKTIPFFTHSMHKSFTGYLAYKTQTLDFGSDLHKLLLVRHFDEWCPYMIFKMYDVLL